MFLYFRASTVWTPLIALDGIIHAIGAGGQGSLSSYLQNQQNGFSTGGGAGAYVRKKHSFSPSVPLTINIGAAGVQINRNTASPGSVSGVDGGDTTVTATGLAITAGGGKKGATIFAASNGALAAQLGGLGGLGSGGDTNIPGGRGGNISAINASLNNIGRATGGGAVDLLGSGNTRGGDITTVGGASGTYIATGGGGLGGNGGDTSGGSANAILGGDAGSLLFPDQLSLTTARTFDSRSLLGFWQTFGPNATASVAPGPFGGSSGLASSTNNVFVSNGGEFAASGGAVSISAGAFQASAGAAGFGAGTGGSVLHGTSQATVGKAGDGIVILELFI
jgi:hypothetical protein